MAKKQIKKDEIPKKPNNRLLKKCIVLAQEGGC